jgi:hypothetical protein
MYEVLTTKCEREFIAASYAVARNATIHALFLPILKIDAASFDLELARWLSPS